MSEPSAADGAPESGTAFPPTSRALLERLGSLYGLEAELERATRVLEPLPAVPVETSTSLGSGAETTARLTLGFVARPEDPHGRAGLVAALSGLASEGMAVTVDELFAGIAPRTTRPLVRGLALRARKGDDVRARPGVRVGGRSVADRLRRIDAAMLQLGLDEVANVHRRIASAISVNPFNAANPYALAFDVDAEHVLGAKTYFACEWAETLVSSLRGQLADELDLDGLDGFELLAASARPERRHDRWLLEASFEVPADPGQGVRAKAYLRSASLAASEAEGHAAVLRLARAMGLEATPYAELLATVRPDGLSTARPCWLMAGVSASARGPSLEVYVFNPVSWSRSPDQSGEPAGRAAGRSQ